jgi:hypothetical protein
MLRVADNLTDKIQIFQSMHYLKKTTAIPKISERIYPFSKLQIELYLNCNTCLHICIVKATKTVQMHH